MKQNDRCIFCMSGIKGQDQICPVCKKGIWEYRWKEDYLEPYTVLHDKYLTGAALEETGEMVRYMGYDMVLDQKVFLYAWNEEIWKQNIEEEASRLFGRFSSPGMTAVKDYFTENGYGFIVTSFAEGPALSEYMKFHGRVSEKKAAEMMLPVIRSVNLLHAGGIIHGNITPEHLVVTEEETLCLLTGCPGSRETAENNSPYTAPEQFEDEGIPGPWTDIYSLGAVWYEMLTGHRPEDSLSRRKKDTMKAPSRYTEVSQRTEDALWQALSTEPQTRFFYLGNLLESMNLPREEEERQAGSIRHIWGEAWLETARRTKEQKKRGRIKGYIWKRALAAGAALAFLAGAGAAGIYAYIKTHQPEYFQWKLEQAKRETDTRPVQGIFEKNDADYGKIKEFILKYGETDSDTDQSKRRNTFYDLEEQELKYCPADHSAAESFYLDYRTAKAAVEFYMDLEGKMNLSETSFYGSGCIDNDEDAVIALFSEKEEIYKVSISGEEIVFKYDALDERLTGIQYQGSRARCAYFLEKMVPLLAPETYLTEKESGELMGTVPEENDSVFLRISGKHQIDIAHRDDYEDGDGKIYEVEIVPEESSFMNWYGLYLDYPEDETLYAGNYERGSDRYKEFVSFVEENAVSVEKSDEEEGSSMLDGREATIYTLEEKDVLKWGEPCNNFRFTIKAEEVVDRLKEKGYEMKKISEKRENTVEIQKYGAILTNFDVLERYRMAEDINLAILKDLVNNDVMQMLVYREAGSEVQLHEAAADAGIAAGNCEEDREELAAQILDTVQKSEKDNEIYYVNDNILFMNHEYKDTGIGIYISPVRQFDGQSYYWP